LAAERETRPGSICSARSSSSTPRAIANAWASRPAEILFQPPKAILIAEAAPMWASRTIG
jgi:hypothetical protein